jgi:hypothetical protein
MTELSYLYDPQLSFRAKGILTYCLNQPQDWVCKRNSLHKVSKEGIDSTDTALNELIKHKYCERVTIRGTNGKVTSVTYTFSPVKMGDQNV